MPSPSLHGWLDAIQRGQLHGGPQLPPGTTAPSMDELLEVQTAYASMTGDRLPLEWLMQTLRPQALAVVPPAPTPRLTGWRSWWPRLQQAIEGVPQAPTPLGLVEWQLRRTRWQRQTRTLLGNSVAVLAAAAVLDILGHGHGTWHTISSVVPRVSLGLMVGTGVSSMVSQWYAPVRRISKVKNALWAHSPLAQSYLHARAKNSPLPLLVRDSYHLDRLCRADGLFRREGHMDDPLPPPVKGKSS